MDVVWTGTSGLVGAGFGNFPRAADHGKVLKDHGDVLEDRVMVFLYQGRGLDAEEGEVTDERRRGIEREAREHGKEDDREEKERRFLASELPQQS